MALELEFAPMRPGLRPGLVATVTREVTPAMRPAFEGGIMHDVLSTSCLVQLLEHAARRVLAPFLEPTEEGAGTWVQVQHLAPTPVGVPVTATATAEEVEGDRLTCRVEARNPWVLVAKGHVEQRVLPAGTIARRMKEQQA